MHFEQIEVFDESITSLLINNLGVGRELILEIEELGADEFVITDGYLTVQELGR